MRRPAEQHTVLRAHRLGLDAVGHYELGAATGCDGGELARHREARTAASEDAGTVCQVDDRGPFESRQRAVHVEVLPERQRARWLDAGEETGHGALLPA